MKTTIKLLIIAFTLASCLSRDNKGNVLDTPTMGEIKIAVDESLKPLIDAEVQAFQGLYHYAKINVVYTSEEEAFDLLMKDSVKLIIATRKLVPSEEEVIRARNIVPTQLAIAKGAVALIVNKQSTDTTLSLTDFKDILQGKKNASANKDLKIVFDQPNSGIIRYLKDSVATFESLPEYCFAVSGNAAVVDYVTKNPASMGLIDVSWICDPDDSISHNFKQSIKVVSVTGDSGSYRPYQAYIAQKQYPLLRDVITVSREARSGLASGFVAYVASDKGQRVVLKLGLVPATMPIRIVEVNHLPL
jgi:phosphate transport system substrate-binding protein